MSTEEKVATFLLALGVAVVVFIITTAVMTDDTKTFTPHPDKDDCLIVNYKINTLNDPTVDKSGVYCKEK